MGVEQSGASPLPDKKGSVTVIHTNSRSGATEPFPLERVWERVLKAERHLFHDKRAPEDALLSGRGDSNTRPLRPERSALANCATSRNSVYVLQKGPSVSEGLFCRDETTRTSDPHVPNVVR